ncbi:MAG TPA: hypothetical protein PKV62_06855, partial [Oscillospiraceae bacterium]|nr:hypothetical protein [Oscillospiraceae bacterium]
NLYPKLFFGMQDHVVAPELRRCSVDLRKCAETGSYSDALENARKVDYLLDVTHENRLITDEVYASIKTDIEEIVMILGEDAACADAAESEPHE